MHRCALLSLSLGLMALLRLPCQAEERPPLVPSPATVDGWEKDLEGTDPGKRRDAIVRMKDAFDLCRNVESELKNDRQKLQIALTEKEALTQELNRRNEQLMQRNGQVMRLEQQIHVMENKGQFDFNKALAKATEQAKKSGNADERLALLELENRQLKQVIAQYQREGHEAMVAQFRSADECMSAFYRLERFVYETRLAQLRGHAIDLVPSLTGLLSAPDWTVQAKAADFLGRLDPPAQAALPALSEALRDRSGMVRALAAEAIWRIEKKKDVVLPVLLDLLENDRFAARAVTQVLVLIGRQDAGVVESLVKLLRSTNVEVAMDAACTLGAIGPNAKSAIPALEAVAKDEREFVRKAAEQALQELNKPAEAKTETLPVAVKP